LETPGELRKGCGVFCDCVECMLMNEPAAGDVQPVIKHLPADDTEGGGL
jgi:hypothetical protein